MRRVFSPFVLLIPLALASAPSALAQKISGDITGTVTDENGAVVPGATITATCSNTGLVRSTLSTESGSYRVADLPVCTYKVSIAMQGFKTVNREVQVAVSTTTKSDFRLQLGQLSEEVTVEAATPVIEFSDKLNSYVDQDRINEMPLNGRDFNALLSTVPGVQRSPGGGFLSINISGQRSTSNNFMIDGISNNDRYYGGIAMGETGVVGLIATVVPADAIQEFTVQQTPGAEFGVKGGAAINIVMKSGTNDFHGSTYYFRHDDWMDAKNYFTEKAGGEKTPLKNQQFGATFGGPIVKDKTFFFGYYEGQRINVGTPYRAFVPTPDQISQARARIAAAGLSTTDAGENLLSFYPTSPDGELAFDTPLDGTSDNFSLKLDHRLNDKNQISLRGMYGRSHQSVYGYSIAPAAPNPPDMFNSVTDPRVKLIGATWSSTLAPNKVLETRVGYNSFSQIIDINNKIDPKSLGIDTGPLDPQDFGVPYVDYFSSFGYIGGVGGYPITTAPNANLDVSSALTWISGKHSFKFGGNFQRATTYSVRNRARTTLEFTTGTGDPVDSIVAMLLGRADYAARSFGSTVRHLRQSSLGFFVNDEWKLSPRFTVNLGLRYDVSQALGEKDDLGANFFPDRGLVNLGQGIDKLYNTDKNNFGPRVGFAWDIGGNSKTALRGGYALSYDIGNFAAVHAPYAINGARTGAFTNPSLGVYSVSLLGDLAVQPDDPAATCLDPDTGAGGDYVCIQPGRPIFGSSPTGQPPFNVFAVDPDLKTPYFHVFHLSFQREVFKSNVVTLSYVGSRGRDLLMVRDINAPPLGTDFSDPQPNRPFAQQYPDFKHIVQLVNDGRSWYDSLQVTWRQANWHGINTQYNLTWSKCMDYNSVNRGGGGEAGQYQNPYNPAGNKGPCDHDVPLNFSVGGVYRVPSLGAGKLGSGWEFSTIFNAFSGRPYTAHVNRDRSGQDFDRVRADCAPGATIQYDTRNPDGYIKNPEMFSNPANGTVGTCGRNTIRGPGFAQWDLALVKNTKIGERFNLQFRVEGFNLLNRANFGFLTTNARSGAFGTISSTPDVDQGNPVVAQGGPRAFQWALRLQF
jgi:Carboxypeptidase regulatory-like domain/TonB dependent receptor/TonB-dependent Receptor Plug Domain